MMRTYWLNGCVKHINCLCHKIFRKCIRKMTPAGLNYAAFFTLYVICFAYLFRKMSGVVALGTLTIVHSAFTLFLGSEMSSMANGLTNTPITIFAIISLLLTCGMNVAALIIIMLMVTTLQKKYNAKIGTPIELPTEEQGYFDTFKSYGLAIFMLTGILLWLITDKYPIFNVSVADRPIPAIIVFALSATIVGLSIKQVMLAARLSKLKNRTVI